MSLTCKLFCDQASDSNATVTTVAVMNVTLS